MSTQLSLFNLPRMTGPELRDAGMEQAAENAGTEWKDQAFRLLKRFLIEWPQAEFMAEQLRAFAYDHGLGKPPSERAWGSVIVAARGLGLIEFSRHASVSNPKAHATPARVWKRKESAHG